MTQSSPVIERGSTISPSRRGSQLRTRTGPLVVVSRRGGVARGALHVAELLARRDRVNAHVVGLLRPVEVPRWVLDTADAGALQEGVRRQRRGRLRQEVHATVGRSSLFSTEMLLGESIRTIREAARARRAEHVLVGLDDPNTPDRIRDERLVLQLARITDRPVIAVPRGCTALPRRALVAVDDGRAGEQVARAAARVLAPGGTLAFAPIAPPQDGDRATALLELARAQECDLIAWGVPARPRREASSPGGDLAALLDGASGMVLVAPPADVDRSRVATPTDHT